MPAACCVPLGEARGDLGQDSSPSHALRLWIPEVVSLAGPTRLSWLCFSSAPPRMLIRNPRSD